MRLRLYVSMNAQNRGRVILRKRAPKAREDLAEDGVYAIGPFQTYAAADICAKGEHAPDVQCVAQFERLAKARATLA